MALRQTIATVLVFFLLAGNAAEAASFRARRAPQDAATRSPRRVLVKFLEDPTPSRRTEILRRHQSRASAHIPRLRVSAIDVPEGETVDQVLARLQPEIGKTIAYAEADRYRYETLTPNDPTLGYQHTNINSFGAWDSKTGSGITIAIADTGVLTTHPDLVDNLLPGRNVIDDSANVTDTRGHGTAVAGTVAAVANNGIGVAGVAYSAKILPIKISSDGTSSDFLIAKAIDYANSQGAKVINISFSSDAPAPFGCWSQTVKDAAASMRANGGLVTISSGNGGLDAIGDDKGCSNDPEIIVVGATDSADALAGFSNYGAEVDVTAPGVLVPSTICTGCAPLGGAEYGSVSGTSFSAPIVAAVLGLIYSVNAGFSADQAQQILFDSVDDLGDAGYDTLFGWGRANANNAVALSEGRSVFFQQQNVDNVFVYPNPWDIRKNSLRQVKFANVPEGATIKIFTVSGFWIKTLKVPSGVTNMPWDLRTDSGDLVASGLYFYLVEAGENKTKGKFAVIK